MNENETLKELKLLFNNEETFMQLKLPLLFISGHGKEKIDTVEFFEVNDNLSPSLDQDLEYFDKTLNLVK